MFCMWNCIANRILPSVILFNKNILLKENILIAVRSKNDWHRGSVAYMR